MHDLVALAELEGARDPGAGGLHPREQGPRVRLQAAPAHLLGVARQPRLYVDPGARHEGAPTGDPLEQALTDQGVERLTHGHPSDPEVLDQLPLRWSGAAWLGTLDQVADVLADLDVLVHYWARAAGSEHVAHRTS